jgi:hypothetical protein
MRDLNSVRDKSGGFDFCRIPRLPRFDNYEAYAVKKEAEHESIPQRFLQDIYAMVNQSPAVLYHGRLHEIMGISGMSDAGKRRAIRAARDTFKARAKEWGVEGHSVFTCKSHFMCALCYTLLCTAPPEM